MTIRSSAGVTSGRWATNDAGTDARASAVAPGTPRGYGRFPLSISYSTAPSD